MDARFLEDNLNYIKCKTHKYFQYLNILLSLFDKFSEDRENLYWHSSHLNFYLFLDLKN